MRRRLVVFPAALSALLLLPGVAAALGTLDQSNPTPNATFTSSPDRFLGQTFTAGITGILDTVEIFQSGEIPIGSTIEIRAAAGGLPTSAILASETTVAVAPAGWLQIPFSAPATVTAGTQYAITMDPPAGQGLGVFFPIDAANAYSGGFVVFDDQLGGGLTGETGTSCSTPTSPLPPRRPPRPRWPTPRRHRRPPAARSQRSAWG